MLSAENRLIAKIEVRGGCWLWTAALNACGYGTLHWNGPFLAHRASYIMFRDEIPDDLTLDHICRNRACVNPWHLEPVPHSENIIRGERATATHCKRGHPYSGYNLVWWKGTRNCRTCHAERSREAKRRWRQRQREAKRAA